VNNLALAVLKGSSLGTRPSLEWCGGKWTS